LIPGKTFREIGVALSECKPLRFISGDEGRSWIPEGIVKIE
jgi:hypothetical protein